MRDRKDIMGNPRVKVLLTGDDGFACQYRIVGGAFVRIIASWGLGWEHVSVSLPDRCPTWAEMCAVKELFWLDEETVVQFHPRKSTYVNCHPYCLHLWRPTDHEIQQPPAMMVGPGVA